MMGSDDFDHEWEKELEEFVNSKAGVKGLVDSRIAKLPRFFISAESGCLPPDRADSQQVQIPVIDFQGIEFDVTRRVQVIDQIRCASQKWGIFQMVNHGVPIAAMDAILESTRRFHEQPKEAKMDLYSSDGRQKVRFYTINGHFEKPDVAGWRDAFSCSFMDSIIDPNIIPSVCRDEIVNYMKYMNNLRDVLSGLLSEALGLSQDSLDQIECMKSQYLSCLYYPPCPEPDKAFGALKHSDPTILTVLVQDDTGGLQIHIDGNWVNVPPIPGAIIAHVGDLLQLISNDKFKSVEHRVLSRGAGTRLSTGCFFYPGSKGMTKAYGPMKELVTEESPALYREVYYLEFVTHYLKSLREGCSGLSNFKIKQENP